MLSQKERQRILREFPETMSKEQFYQVAHISKRQAQYLLQEGIVPCQIRKTVTHKYVIDTRDVIAYLESRPAQGTKSITAMGKLHRYGYHLPDDLSPKLLIYLRAAYEAAFERMPDVMEIEQIGRVICYAYDTIYKWCASGKLKSIQVSNKHLIPKEWLFEFMLSKEFLFKPMPSDWQIVTVHRALLNYKKEE